MRRTNVLAFLFASFIFSSFAVGAEHIPLDGNHANKWLNHMLDVAGNEVERIGARPTILSRQMAIVMTAMYDAWACYDEKAVGVCFRGTLRRPPEERTEANKNKAIAYACFQTLKYAFPNDVADIEARMIKMGYNPGETSRDTAKPEGIGNYIADAIIESRKHDGANQAGDEIGSNGKPYSDYTYYKPFNPPDKIIDVNRWQPITFTDAKGNKFTPGFLTPHWYRVKSFALQSPDQFRPGPPPAEGSEQLIKETKECIDCNANLTMEQKAIVEFMRDGPRSTGQSGHWLRFAQECSRRDKNDLDRDVKLYFAIANMAMDAFISCWETKRFYDSGRPYWYARYYFKDKDIQGWGGPGKGTVPMKGENWHPYSPENFITPPFPGYTSGHATVSGACAKILELFHGTDQFGIAIDRNCCVLTEPVPGPLIKLKLPTYSGSAEMAAISRMLGGYHIRTDNEVGLQTGRKIAEYEWPIYKAYFDGTKK